MMMNLFSSFNPLSWMSFNLNWITLILVPMIISMKMWKISSESFKVINMIMNMMNKQLKPLMPKSMKMNLIMMMTLLMMITTMNTSGMFPYIYTPTAMPQISLPLALSMWMSINMKKMKKINNMMSKMTPENTPTAIIPLMVTIETVSLMIQPLTLTIRLTANITAGHILMTLISSSYSMKSWLMMTIINMMMSLMEMCMAVIQAYVFSMLLTMYNK